MLDHGPGDPRAWGPAAALLLLGGAAALGWRAARGRAARPVAQAALAGLGWFVASLFLGPIATLLIVVLDKRQSA